MRRSRARRLSGWGSVGLAAALAAGCATNPVTGRPQLALISEAQEIEIGRQAAQEAEQSIGLVDRPELQSYVQRIGGELARVSQRPHLPWSFRVVDDPVPNAFALPGGFIFVTRGLIELMDSEAELASVLGHEIGHVTARHSVSQISRAQLAQIGLVVGAVALPQYGGALQNLGGTGLQLLFLKYGRDAERQADELGFDYALANRYDVREMADVFRSLQRVGEREQRSALPSWLATHPYPAERIEAVQARVAALGRGLDSLNVGSAPFLALLDGLVYGENPRNGFFRGSSFLHPDLRFQLDFPAGWRGQNLPHAVMAASPNGDAVVQLTFAQGDPETAARRFLSQQGIRPGQASRESFNGLPGVVATFQAQTQSGVITGLAAFVSHGERTFQMLAFTPAQRFPGYQPTLARAVASFRVLTDPQALAVRPNRLRLVRIDRAMTLGEFNTRYPSVVPLEELALLNQLPDAAARLPAGARVKRVVTE